MTRRQIALLAVVVLVAVAGCSGAQNTADSGGSDLGMQSAGDGSGGSSGGGGVGSYYDADGDRVIVRESRMDLRVDNFTRAFRSTREIAAAHGGYVGDRSQNSRGDWDEGRITVRVPPENFSEARDDLAVLGHVEDESVSVQDFTDEYNDREARIEDLQQEERALESLLSRANDSEEASEIRNDLREVRDELRTLRQQQSSLERREAMSTIRIDAHEPVSEQPPENYRSSFGFDDAFMEAFYGGLTAVKYVVVFFGYAIPIGLSLLPLAAFGLVLVGGFRRTRRFVSGAMSADSERANDSPAVVETSGDEAGTTDDGEPDGGETDE
ncbi:DUF4349 domain-containing protein [Halomicrobium sp. ZPS1]|uniref:DUF4349 domain-containing protein n=1 Tax=Halomicrobium mukohataei TaxID=57705 RepID=A0A4D6KKF9_9EURY|nr:DUF4349 domain-containing protein [Halomicrobium mukohataei]QFR21908.1 DUF4349 domain-containing protein [Halomicrobium sp. ZPS1]